MPGFAIRRRACRRGPRATQPGWLLEIALAGAIRKGKAAAEAAATALLEVIERLAVAEL